VLRNPAGMARAAGAVSNRGARREGAEVAERLGPASVSPRPLPTPSVRAGAYPRLSHRANPGASKNAMPETRAVPAHRGWTGRRAEGLLGRVERGSAKSLSDEELLALPVLYRQALSSLSVARATSLDHSLIDYLESLSTRAYFFVYGTRAGLRQRLALFFEQT